jgi:hypothetical protein
MDPLANLQDIHLPDAVVWWPPAPGWWLLALFVLAFLTWLSRSLWRRYQRKQAQRLALQRLKNLKQNYIQQQNGLQTLKDLSVLLRWFAMQQHPREHVSALQGQAWLTFLDRSGHTQHFTMGVGSHLADASYQQHLPPQAETDLTDLFQLSRQWIRQQC